MDEWHLAGAASAIEEGGEGLRLVLPLPGGNDTEPAFVIRHDGQLHAYLNRCGHVPVELDFPEGRFFDDEATFIVCATHGATYSPATGACLAGPCAGKGLVRLELREDAGSVWVRRPPGSEPAGPSEA